MSTMATRVAPLALATAALLAGCGGTAAESGVEPGTRIQATADEFSFEPSSWTVPAGQEVTLELTDEGALEHEWVILTSGTQIAASAEFEESMVLWEIEAHPEQTVSGAFTAPAAGSYQVICAIEGHLESGMEGTLTVVE